MKRQTLVYLFLIMGLAAISRFYRINELAVFLADQASDSTQVLNILRGNLTLLGPITSVGGFYNGPIVYYLMTPFYWVFKADPVSGTIFQSTLQIATIPLIYLIAKKLRNEQVGLLATFLFAISPLMIDYSRAAFNSYPAVFFSTLIVYLLLKLSEKFSLITALIMGVAIGWIVQMHYFAAVFLILAMVYPIFNKKLLSIKYCTSLLVGFLVGISPFLLFEVRHQFLNTNLFMKYFFSEKESVKSVTNVLNTWPEVTAWLLTGRKYILGLVAFFISLTVPVYLYLNDKNNKNFLILFLLLILVSMVGLLYGGIIQTHYLISFQTSLIILFALSVNFLLKEKKLFILGLGLLLLFFNSSQWNLNLDKHPLQDGMNIKDFKVAAQIIKSDKKGSYNVGMHTQGDNRAMPLRYTLNLLGESPMSYEKYYEADYLYFIVKKSEPVTSLKMWEYTSFGPSEVQQKWEINDKHFLYKLKKKPSARF